jgi:hypothetical protein
VNEPTPFATPHHLKDNIASGASSVSYGTDDGWIVNFREEPEFMEYLSKQSGSPIYRTRIMTNMIAPGNTKTVWDHPTTGIEYEMVVDDESGEVHTDWKVLEQCENGDVPEPLKFPKAWARFLKKTTTAADGWPVEEWGVITKSYALSLKAQNVHTVQQLASLTDANAQNIMGALKYRDLAKAALDERAKTRILSREQERASKAEEQVALLSKQVADLKTQMVAMQAERAEGHQPPWSGDRPPVAHGETAPQLRKLSASKAKAARAKAAGVSGAVKGAQPLAPADETEAA